MFLGRRLLMLVLALRALAAGEPPFNERSSALISVQDNASIIRTKLRGLVIERLLTVTQSSMVKRQYQGRHR